MGSSHELQETLKTKVVDAHNAGEGYKKIAERFQLSVSTVRNVIKRWQLTGSVEARLRSGRPRKLSERTARLLINKANQNPHLTAKNLQEDLADSGLVVHRSTVQRCLLKHNLYGNRRGMVRKMEIGQKKPGAVGKKKAMEEQVPAVEVVGRPAAEDEKQLVEVKEPATEEEKKHAGGRKKSTRGKKKLAVEENKLKEKEEGVNGQEDHSMNTQDCHHSC